MGIFGNICYTVEKIENRRFKYGYKTVSEIV